MINRSTGCRWLFFAATTVVGGLGVPPFVAGPAAAQTCYPPGSAACSTTTTVAATGDPMVVSDTTLVPGQPIEISAGGFLAGTTVTFTIESVEQTLGTATATQQGRATATVTIPTGIAPGRHTIFAKGTGADGQPRSVSEPVTVTGSVATGTAASGGVGGTRAQGGEGSLARTGAYTASAAALGVALVGGGSVLGRAAKRRKGAAV